MLCITSKQAVRRSASCVPFQPILKVHLQRYKAKMAESTPAASADAQAAPSDPIVQYVVLRSDLWSAQMKWPLGSVAAQACHASTAVLWTYKDDPDVIQYCADLDHMRKVVLEVKDEAALRKLSDQLIAAGILHKLWIEQPENYATSLATKPYPKSIVGQHVKKLQLCRTPVGKQ